MYRGRRGLLGVSARRAAACLTAVTALAACVPQDRKPVTIQEALEEPAAEIKEFKGGVYKVGKPYRIQGVRYVPREDWGYDEVGIASWYGPHFHGRKTSNGEVFDMNALTAAHPTLPMPTRVRVTNLENGRSVVLRLNDRGPFKAGRIIDVSRRAAEVLGFRQQGSARVRVEMLGKAPIEVFVFDKPAEDAEPLASRPVAAVSAQTLSFGPSDDMDGLDEPYSAPRIVETPAPVPASTAGLGAAVPLSDALSGGAADNSARWEGTSISPEPRIVESRPGAIREARPPSIREAARAADPIEMAPSEGGPISLREAVSRGGAPHGFDVALEEAINIQAGSFLLPQNAARMQDNIMAALSDIADVRVVAEDVGGLTRHKVLVGPVETRAGAERALEILDGLGYPNARIVAN